MQGCLQVFNSTWKPNWVKSCKHHSSWLASKMATPNLAVSLKKKKKMNLVFGFT